MAHDNPDDFSSQRAPRLSVLMTTYNGERFLSEAIVSVLEQTFTDFELIIVDDGSTDGSASVIRSFTSHDSRVRGIFLLKNVGISRAANRGLREVRAPLIARVDSDDICDSRRFAKQVSYMDEHSDIYILGCRSVNIDELGNRMKSTREYRVAFARGRKRVGFLMGNGSCTLLHPTLVYRTFAVRALNGYNAQLPFGEDDDLCLRLFDHYGCVLDNLSESLLFYRRHGSSISHRKRFRKSMLVQLLVQYSSECRARGLADPILSASDLSWSGLNLSSKERERFVALNFFNSLRSFPADKQARATLLLRATRLLEEYFPSKAELGSFPHPYLQLARASARARAWILFLRYITQALRYNFWFVSSLLWEQVVFSLHCILEEGLAFIQRLFHINR